VVYMFIIERTPKRHVFLKRLDCYVYILFDLSRFNSQHNRGYIPHHFMTPTLLTVKIIATKREDRRISKIVVNSHITFTEFRSKKILDSED